LVPAGPRRLTPQALSSSCRCPTGVVNRRGIRLINNGGYFLHLANTSGSKPLRSQCGQSRARGGRPSATAIIAAFVSRPLTTELTSHALNKRPICDSAPVTRRLAKHAPHEPCREQPRARDPRSMNRRGYAPAARRDNTQVLNLVPERFCSLRPLAESLSSAPEHPAGPHHRRDAVAPLIADANAVPSSLGTASGHAPAILLPRSRDPGPGIGGCSLSTEQHFPPVAGAAAQ
jgi:hypothetical protein